MIPLHELLSRIHWDAEFGRGEFRIAFLDKVLGTLIHRPIQEVRQDADVHFNFEVTDEQGIVHRVH